jgi:aryl-alcohol dehydrogenase-like predicted oxidoreductase/predicted GIY-YIG superfamily endonuclease
MDDPPAYVYLLRCADGSLYCGWTTDVERRVAAHAAGRGGRYTRSRLPVELVLALPQPTRAAARRAEAAVKALPRADKLALVAGSRAVARRVAGRAHPAGAPRARPAQGRGLAGRPRRMRYRQLGDSDLQVSAISLGSWLTYSGGVAREQTEACTRAAFDADITFFDTANVYGRGASEEAWGEILSGYDRGSYVLATKVYFPMSESDRGLSARQIGKQLDASLERLRTDFVDLYQCHRYDDDTPLEETVRALSDAIRAGKARYWGFSEWTAEQIDAALRIARDEGLEKPVSSQPQYSPLWRRIEDNGVLRVSEANGISQVVWSPLAQGVLTGKYRPGEPPPEGTRAASEEMGGFISGFFRDDVLEAVQRLKPVAEQAGMTLAQLSLAWILRRPDVASAIIGASRPEQVHENAAAADLELSDDVVRAVDEALGDAARLGDEDR